MRLAHDIASVCPLVVADMVDASTFSDLAGRYRVMGVPMTLVNGRLTQLGAAPEGKIVDLVLEAQAMPGAD